MVGIYTYITGYALAKYVIIAYALVAENSNLGETERERGREANGTQLIYPSLHCVHGYREKKAVKKLIQMKIKSK